MLIVLTMGHAVGILHTKRIRYKATGVELQGTNPLNSGPLLK